MLLYSKRNCQGGGVMNKKPVKEIGGRIREIRRGLGINQTLFGGIFGVSQEAVSAWEKGAYPDAMILLGIASRGQTSIDWILTGNGIKPLQVPGTNIGKSLKLDQQPCSLA